MHTTRSILITGASSGLGAALAAAYAAEDVRLALTGRHAGRLAAVAAACRRSGASVLADTVDVTDRAAMAAFIAEADDAWPLDLVVANAGISAGSGRSGDGDGGETEMQARRLFSTNLDGTLNTIYPAVARMRAHGRGQIALMSSLAGFRGLPGAPAYSASKAAVKVLGEALRLELAPAGIVVSVICPGFVRTAMTATNDFRMPFLMDAEKAARLIIKGLVQDRPRIAFPFPMLAASWFIAALPVVLGDRLIRRLPRKGMARPAPDKSDGGTGADH
jgi:short-subunit dehydrogenase